MMSGRTPEVNRYKRIRVAAGGTADRAEASRRARRRLRLLKLLIYAVTFILMFLMYGDPNLTLFGLKPNLMLPLAGCALLFEGPCMSVGLAVTAGLLTDLLRQTPFGINGLALGILAFGLWSLARLWLRPVLLNGLFSSLILSFTAHTLDFLLVYGWGSGYFMKLYFWDAVVSGLFALVLFFPVRLVYRKLRYVI